MYFGGYTLWTNKNSLMAKIRTSGDFYFETEDNAGSCTFSDCLATTIRIECVNYCLTQLGKNNTQAELQLIMHLEADISSKISNTLYRSRFNSYDDLQIALTDDEMRTLKERFTTLTQFQRRYLYASSQEKISMLGLDDNNSGSFEGGTGNLDLPTDFVLGGVR